MKNVAAAAHGIDFGGTALAFRGRPTHASAMNFPSLLSLLRKREQLTSRAMLEHCVWRMCLLGFHIE